MNMWSIDASLRYKAKVADASRQRYLNIDQVLLWSTVSLVAIGWIMVGSASVSLAEKEAADTFYYLQKQGIYILVGLLLGILVMRIRIDVWERINPYLLIMAIILLILVLGLGKDTNGSTRWFSFGFIKLQPSEILKLTLVMYLSGYVVRRREELQNSVKGFMNPIMLVSVIAILLLLEPDFGATAVITVTTFGMLFIGGMRLKQFGLLILLMLTAFSVLAFAAPYRVERLKSFLNPWADPFDSGFQLTQALIAFGRGEWWGVGLGSSIQKLFYLPEAHTDFLFAVLAEELGLIGVCVILLLFGMVVYRALRIGYMAFNNRKFYAAYLAFGIGILIAVEAFTNIGVNMGVLPTKGLVLPFMSYGGSSMLVSCVACAVLLRIYHENSSQRAKVFSENANDRAKHRLGNYERESGRMQ